MRHDAEGAARFLLDSTGSDGPPTDVTHAAQAWGYDVQIGDRSTTAGPLIVVERSLSAHRRRWHIAHELGHIAARHTGMDPRCERTANAIASALLMPQHQFSLDVAASRWSLTRLCTRYEVSFEAAAWRLSRLRRANVSVWDNGELRRTNRREATPVWESSLARFCREERTTLTEESGLLRAYWLPSPGWERVIVVSGAAERWGTEAISGMWGDRGDG